MSSCRALSTLVLLLLSAGIAARPDDGRHHYAAGIVDARAGEYAAARTHFRAAAQAGLDLPALTYNLGVVSYHLDDFDAARAAFRKLTEDPEWRALAHYNLGLVEEAAGRESAALGHFQQARRHARQPKLRAMAERKLADEPSTPEPAWHGLIALGGGYDDNVILADDRLIDTVSEEADAFGEILAAARRPLSGGDDRGLRLDVASYYRAHADLNDFDFGALTLSLAWDAPLRGWALSTGLRGEAQFAGGESYANVLTHRLLIERSGWEVRNDLSYLSGGPGFDYVSGVRNRTRIRFEATTGIGRVRAGYEFELNDREDLSRGSEFFSYSPRVQKLHAGWQLMLSEAFTLEPEATFRWSDYADENRFVDSTGNLVTAARDQDVTTLSLRGRYRLSGDWYLWGQLQQVDSESRILRYDYTSTRYLIGFERLF